jgi:hypothetical protein
LTVDHRDRDGAFVAGSGADTFKGLGSHIFVIAIDDDGFESAAREFADSGVSVTAKFHSNFQITEDPSQDPCGLVVRAQNQSLQTHR